MTNKFDPKEWAKDFESFMNSEAVSPPAHINNKILDFVRGDLNPSIWKIIAKLSGIHVVMGSLSLLVCSQFGMGSAPMLFMSLGHVACTALCGSFFLGLSTLIAGIWFSPEELRKMRSTGYSPILVLGILSLITFLVFGAEIALNLAAIWLLGAFAAGAIATELILGIRRLAHS